MLIEALKVVKPSNVFKYPWIGEVVDNNEHIYQAIKKQHDDYLHITHCPICLSQADFHPRPTNQTFTAECTNLECGVNYKLVSNAHQDKAFYLQASGDWKKGGRWHLNFKVQ